LASTWRRVLFARKRTRSLSEENQRVPFQSPERRKLVGSAKIELRTLQNLSEALKEPRAEEPKPFDVDDEGKDHNSTTSGIRRDSTLP